MRYVTVPEQVIISGKPFPFVVFLEEVVFSSPAWRADINGWDGLERCSKAFAEAAPGTIVELQDKDHERMWNVILQANINGAVAALIVPFFRAIGGATMEPPKEK